MKHVALFDVPEEVRDLVRECEIQGTRSVFERDGRPVAVLVSYDEYVALRETIAIANQPLLYARLAEADEAASRTFGQIAELDDLERLRIAPTVERDYATLDGDERPEAVDALRRIDDDPIIGAPLFDPLKGLWAYGTPRLRIIYRIVTEGRIVLVLSITRAGIDSAA